MSYLVDLSFAIIFLILGLASYSYLFYRIYQNRDRLELKILGKKYGIFLFIPLVLFLICSILFNTQFFKNPNNVDTLLNPIHLSIGDGFLLYIGTIILVLSLFTLVSSFIFYYYLPKSPQKFRKVCRILMFSLIPVVILAFIMASEGNADYLHYPLVNRLYIGKEGIKLVTVMTGNDWAKAPEGGITIAFYALFIMLGAILVLIICDHQIYKEYGHHGLITACFFIAFPSGIFGARFWYVIGEGMPISELFNFRDGGLTILGGAATGIVIGVLFMIILKFTNKRYKKLDYLKLVDFIVPCILVAQAVGRWGNFFNNEVHGGVSAVSSYMWLPTFIKNNMYFSSASGSLPFLGAQIYSPFFLIECLLNLTGYFFIEYGIRNLFGFKKYHAEGSCGGWYLVWYGIVRIIMEPLRDPHFIMGENKDWSVIQSGIYIGVGAGVILIAIIIKILRMKGIIKLKIDQKEDDTIEVN